MATREHVSPSSCKRPRPTSASSSDSRASSQHQLQTPDGNDHSEVNPRLLRCYYRSKQCPNQRALKINGENHKLCEYHRRRANLNQQRVHQQRVHQRRKIRMKQSEWLASSSHTETDGMGSAATGAISFPSTDLHCDEDAGLWTVLEPYTSPCGDLPIRDLIILEALLFSSATLPKQGRGQDASAVPKVYVYANDARHEL